MAVWEVRADIEVEAETEAEALSAVNKALSNGVNDRLIEDWMLVEIC